MAKSVVVTGYLLAYNISLFIGWLIILIKSALVYFNPNEVYSTVSVELKIFQTAALLEIVHSATGLVRSPVVTTAMQVFSRLVILWAVTYSVKESQQSIGIPLYVFAWSVTEVVRYSFYAFTLLDQVPYFLLWLRYTLFIVLYPTGVVGELAATISALPSVKEHKIYSFELPNPGNISFSYYYALCAFMLLYIPFFPQLYCYMFAQREKYLRTEMKKKKE